MNEKNIIKKIIKDCYWDLNFSEKEILKIVNGSDLREKLKLFDKIVMYSTDKLYALQIFSKDELKKIFEMYEPKFRKDKIETKLKILRKAIFDENIKINHLEWKHRNL